MKNLSFTIVLTCFVFLLGCSEQKSKWKEAKKANTINAFNKYIQEFPTSPNIVEAKTNISNLIVDMIKERYYNKSYMPDSNDDFPIFWKGTPFIEIRVQKIDHDGEMGLDGSIKPIPGRTKTIIQFLDNSLKMECLFVNDGNHKLVQFNIAENTMIEMMSGAKYVYRNGQFVK